MSKGSPLNKKQLDLLDFNFFIKRLKSLDTIHTRTTESTVDIKKLDDPKLFSPVENLLIQYALNKVVNELKIIDNGCSKRFCELGNEFWGCQEPFKRRGEVGELQKKIVCYPSLQKLKDDMIALFFSKISKDIEWCANTFDATLKELHHSGSYDYLINSIEADRTNEMEEFQLIKNYTKNKYYLDHLEKKHAEYKQKSDLVLADLDNRILNLGNKIYDTRIQSAIKTRLVQKWENTRFTQSKLMLNSTEQKLRHEVDSAKQRLDIEGRAIIEIETFLKFEIDKIKEQTEYWRTRYEKEVEQLDNGIQMANDNITDLKRQYEEMRELYESRNAEMDDYWTKKRLEAEAIALIEKKCNCAIRIQAWWRGTMVRRHLGPYKKKKKGKGGRGKKK